MTITFSSLPVAVRLSAPLAVAALVATACSSSGGSGSTGAGSGPTTAGVAAKSTSHAAGGAAEVEAHSGSEGTFLTDGSGRSLYLYTPDTGTTSTCTGVCASQWPPLTTQGGPTAGSGATASDLGTTKRSDGSMQVTYKGHPLYYFSGDSSAGQTNGEGFGGIWFLVSPTGAEVKGGSSSSSASTGSSSSTGSGSGSGGGNSWG